MFFIFSFAYGPLAPVFSLDLRRALTHDDSYEDRLPRSGDPKSFESVSCFRSPTVPLAPVLSLDKAHVDT